MVKKDRDKYRDVIYTQKLSSVKFVKDFQTWKKNCLSISGDSIFVENVPTLYDFLNTHVIPSGGGKNVRDESVNAGRDEGAKNILDEIEEILEGGKFSLYESMVISSFANVLEEMEGTSLDPANILFTDKIMRGGKVIEEVEVYGHYRTENYKKKTKKPAAPSDWYSTSQDTANPPPRQALYSKESGTYSKPKGLLYILQEASDELLESELEDVEIPFEDNDFEEMNKVSVISEYFDKAITNENFWTLGGMLRVNILRRDFRNTQFKNLNEKDQNLLAEIAGLNEKGKRKKDAPVGQITEFKPLDATAGALIELIDRALKRAGKNTAPNGYRAWQNQRKKGFDYRKTAKEVYPDIEDRPKSGKGSRTQMKPTTKVISKIWQSHLWR